MPFKLAPPPKAVVLKPVRANLGIEAAYRARMEVLIDEMHVSLRHWLLRAYEDHAPEMAQDASVTDLKAVMRRLTSRWQRKFNELSNEMAQGFLSGIVRHTDRTFQQNLKDAGWTVKFQASQRVRQITAASIEENVQLIRSIASEHLSDVSGLVMRATVQGRNLAPLAAELEQRYGVTRRRAALIARDQCNKATAAVNQARQVELGIDEAIWMHSGGGKQPRPSHVQAGRDKLRFKVSEGALIDGARILPGMLVNCRCTSRPVIPGFEDA